MSTNIKIKTKNGSECPIWQTPTQISNMIMTNSKGEVEEFFTGKRALLAVHQYIQWVKGSLNRQYSSKEEMQLYKEDVEEEVRTVKNWISNKPIRKLIVELS